ncbi:hypothetical protein [Candidatus Korobacter versatilis]|nr:hypothetical protein [Candidatus Koribacter versatilis]
MRKLAGITVVLTVVFAAWSALAATPATMVTPVAGSKFAGANVTFTWNAGAGVSQYSLYIGTTPGAHDLAFVSTGVSTTTTVNGLPTDGRNIYVTLYSLIAGVWQGNRYSYFASGAGVAATMTAPAAGSKLAGASVTFSWNTGAGISQYSLYVGNTKGAHDIAFSSGNVTSKLVNGLPTDGRMVYVTLYSLNGSTWLRNYYTYVASGVGVGAVMSSPAPGSTFANSAANFSWTNGTGVSEYSLYVGSTPGAHDIAYVNAGSIPLATVTNLPTNGSTVYINLYSLNGATWLRNSYTYTAAAAPSKRVAWIPDFYGETLQVRIGTGAGAIATSVNLPTCNPNSVAVNSDKAYVVCSAFEANPDKILVYDATVIRASAGGVLAISPTKTITSAQFNSLIGIAFDAGNNLWVASYGNHQINEITAAELAKASPTATAELVHSPDNPVTLTFDSSGGMWVSGQYSGGIVLHFPSSQIHSGSGATPDYCLATTDLGAGCQFVDGIFLNPEGLALYNGDVWVANNATGAAGEVPGRQLVDLKFNAGNVTVNGTFGDPTAAAKSPFVCPGGLFAGAIHLWINDESYAEADPQCGAMGDVSAATGGVFAFTPAQLAARSTSTSQVLPYSGVTGRPGFGGIFVEKDQ